MHSEAGRVGAGGEQTVKLEVSALAGNIPLNDSVVSLFLLWTALMSQLHMLFTAHCRSTAVCWGLQSVEAQCQCGRKVDHWDIQALLGTAFPAGTWGLLLGDLGWGWGWGEESTQPLGSEAA